MKKEITMRSGWAEALGITAKWLGIGTIGFIFDWLSHKASHAPFHYSAALLFFLLMPLVVGLPIALIDRKLSAWIRALRFIPSLLARGVVYVASSLIAGFIFLLVERHFLGLNSSLWTIAKFIGFWLPASFFVLALRNLLKHFEVLNILKWVQGEYHEPTEEDRVFLFIDIKDSTTIAEVMGNKTYFGFIQEFHHAAAEPIQRNKGEVYQYIGDEIVITWPLQKGTHHNRAISLFFEIEHALQSRSQLFLGRFGSVPVIKGALHAGKVTRGEIGKAKKEFGYVGDVINTTARMQTVAKTTPGVSLVISQKLLEHFHDAERFDPKPLGHHVLKGKNERVSLYTLHAPESTTELRRTASLAHHLQK